jgi:hypothetical protein
MQPLHHLARQTVSCARQQVLSKRCRVSSITGTTPWHAAASTAALHCSCHIYAGSKQPLRPHACQFKLSPIPNHPTSCSNTMQKTTRHESQLVQPYPRSNPMTPPTLQKKISTLLDADCTQYSVHASMQTDMPKKASRLSGQQTLRTLRVAPAITVKPRTPSLTYHTQPTTQPTYSATKTQETSKHLPSSSWQLCTTYPTPPA